MRKIIEEGKKEFITTCKKCGTKFSYELNDIEYGKVNCPLCGDTCYHELNTPAPDPTYTYPHKSYFDENLGVWVNPCTKQQPSTDPYEKIPYWMRPDYKAPEVTCNTDNSVSTLLDTDTLSNS